MWGIRGHRDPARGCVRSRAAALGRCRFLRILECARASIDVRRRETAAATDPSLRAWCRGVACFLADRHGRKPVHPAPDDAGRRAKECGRWPSCPHGVCGLGNPGGGRGWCSAGRESRRPPVGGTGGRSILRDETGGDSPGHDRARGRTQRRPRMERSKIASHERPRTRVIPLVETHVPPSGRQGGCRYRRSDGSNRSPVIDRTTWLP